MGVERPELVGVHLDLQRGHATLVAQRPQQSGQVPDAGPRQQPAVHGLVAEVGSGRGRHVTHLHGDDPVARIPEVEPTGIGAAPVVPRVDHHPAVGTFGAPHHLVSGATVGHPREREVLDVDEQPVPGRLVAHRGEGTSRLRVGDVGTDPATPYLEGGDRSSSQRRRRLHELEGRGPHLVAREPSHRAVELGHRQPQMVQQLPHVGRGAAPGQGRPVVVVVHRDALEPGRGGGPGGDLQAGSTEAAAAQHPVPGPEHRSRRPSRVERHRLRPAAGPGTDG